MMMMKIQIRLLVVFLPVESTLLLRPIFATSSGLPIFYPIPAPVEFFITEGWLSYMWTFIIIWFYFLASPREFLLIRSWFRSLAPTWWWAIFSRIALRSEYWLCLFLFRLPLTKDWYIYWFVLNLLISYGDGPSLIWGNGATAYSRRLRPIVDEIWS